MCHKKLQVSTNRYKGFTLIEVLVAVLVLSIGLLGLASLQATSLRNNNDASMLTRAGYIASDMADRMRANPSQVTAYPGAVAAAGNGACITAACTPAETVGNDTLDWNNLLKALPAGQGDITDQGGGLFTITVRWDEARTGATGKGCNPDAPADLRCLTITTRP